MKRWKPPVDGDSLNEYDLQCEEKEERDEKDIVKISECVQPFDAEVVKIKPFDTEVLWHFRQAVFLFSNIQVLSSTTSGVLGGKMNV